MPAVMNSPERLWRTQFNKQLTNEVMERVIKQTMILVRKIERKAPWRDQQSAHDRLHSVIVRLLDGSIKWDPERVDLERFLLVAVAGDLSHELRHAAKFDHVSLDDETRNGETLEAETSEAIAADRVVKNEVPKRAWWSDVITELRKQTHDDRFVLAILDAYDQGAFTRREVMMLTGLTSKQYHAAYQRLVRAAQKIDADARELVVEAIA